MRKILLLLFILITTTTAAALDGTGGTITHSGSYTIHTFTSNGTFTPPQSVNITYLIIAGGGGGGGSSGGGSGGSGGGGAGGLLYGLSYLLNSSYNIVIGSGGPGGAAGGSNPGTNGTNSTFNNLTSEGGGGGGQGVGVPNNKGRAGGSGGGGGYLAIGGNGVPGQGLGGGNSTSNGGAGGGGNGSVGGNAAGNPGGTAGTGGNYSINGTYVIRACGGGGGGYQNSGGSSVCGGAGGADSQDGLNAPATTGSGGGGSGGTAAKTGGNGASGVILIAYLSPMNISDKYNNATFDNSTNITVLSNNNYFYNITTNVNGNSFSWAYDGVDQSRNANNISLQIGAGNHTLTATARNTTDNTTDAAIWYIIASNITQTLLSPTNGSTTSNPVTLLWQEWPQNSPNMWQVSDDYQFINIISSGTTTPANSSTPYMTATTSLNPGVYYWHVKNVTGIYSNYSIFTISTPAATPGRFNITVFDEQTGARISSFSAQIYNQTTTLNKSTTTGWVNYSASEVASGQYLIRIIPNSSYASRSVLATSPTNVSVWLPATSNTIDTIAFYLLDYTNKFPWDTSYLSLTKNSTVMYSAYFDADAKVAAYLIRGESYGITITNGNNIQNWGNYISTASGNVEVVIMNIGVNSTLRNPFVYNVTWNSNDIILQWSDSFGVMTSLNYSIYKGSSKTLVHQLITSVDHGSSDYIVTNTSDVYYVSVSALTTNGYRNQTYVIDYRAGSAATDGESSDLYTWSYGSVTIPAWVKNAFAVLALMILAGSFGAMHRGEGAIITGIMSLVFWKWTWLSATGAGVGFLGALVLFAVLYHLDTKRKGGGYF